MEAGELKLVDMESGKQHTLEVAFFIDESYTPQHSSHLSTATLLEGRVLSQAAEDQESTRRVSLLSIIR